MSIKSRCKLNYLKASLMHYFQDIILPDQCECWESRQRSARVAAPHGRQGWDHTDTHWAVGSADSKRMLGALLSGAWHPFQRMPYDQALRWLVSHVLRLHRKQALRAAASGHGRHRTYCYRWVLYLPIDVSIYLKISPRWNTHWRLSQSVSPGHPDHGQGW